MKTSSADLFDELADEFVERYRNGDRPTPAEYAERHPDLADEILDLFPTLVAMELAAHDSESGQAAASEPRTFGSTPPDRLGDFRIIREIGRGGMGVVYEAEQESLGRHVALKVLSDSTIASHTHQRRFQREAKAAARMHHTNIVPVFGVGEADGHHFYIMQYIPGLALDDVLSEVRRQQNGKQTPDCVSKNGDISASATVVRSMFTGNYLVPDLSVDSDDNAGVVQPDFAAEESKPAANVPISHSSSAIHPVKLPSDNSSNASTQTENPYWNSVARIGIQVAEALAYAHSQGIIHRDIKPANLLLDAAGTVWVTDFGLASLEDHQNLTRTGDIIGTLRYMPPESFSGQSDARGDLYSLGLTIYELLALKPAIRSTDRNQTLKMAMEAKHERLGQINSTIPRDLQTIVHKAIHCEPDLRYQTASELAEDLNRFLRDEPIHARRASSSERLVRWSRRNPIVSSLTAACAALLILMAGVFWYAWITTSTALSEVQTQAAQLEIETQRAIDSEQSEIRQKKRALQQEAIANQAREKAQTLAKDESKAHDQAEANLYIGHIALADREYQANNITAARELLDECPFPLRGWEWHYLHRLVTNGLQDTARIGELRDDARLVLNSDGTRIAAFGAGYTPGSKNRQINHGLLRILDAQTFDVVASVEGLQRARPKALFFPDGKRLLVTRAVRRAVEIKTTTVQPRTTGPRKEATGSSFANFIREQIRRQFQAPTPEANETTEVVREADETGVTKVVKPNLRFRASRVQHFGSLAIHSAETGEELLKFPEFNGDTISIAVHPNGKNVASLTRHSIPQTSQMSRRLSIYDVKSGTTTFVENLPGSGFWGHIEFSPNGDHLLVAGMSDGIEIRDSQSGAVVRQIDDAANWNTESVRFSPDSKRIATVNQLGMISIYDVATAERRMGIYCGESKLWDLDYSADGQWIASAHDDHSVKIWNSASGALQHHFRHHVKPRTVRFLHDRNSLISISNIGRLQEWDLKIGPLPQSFTTDLHLTTFDHLSQQLIGTRSRELIAIDPQDPGTEKPLLPANEYEYSTRTKISADGRRSLRVLSGRTFEVQDLVSGEQIHKEDGWIFDSAINSNGNVIAVQRHIPSESAYTVDIIHLNHAHRVTIDVESSITLCLDHDGRQLLIGDERGNVRVVDTSSGKELQTLDASGAIRAIAVSPDGKLAAIADERHEIKLFQLSNGECLHELVGHSARTSFLAFHPDGKRLASAGMDCDVRLWDPKTGRCMIKLRGHRHTIRNTMSFSPNGRQLLTQDVVERVRIWDATIDETLRLEDLKQQAENHLEAADYDMAVDFYTQAIALDPSDTSMISERGRANALSRRWSLARADYEQAILMGRTDVWTQFRPGFLAFMMGDFEAYKAIREDVLERNFTTDRADIAQETFRLSLLMQDDNEFFKDPRILAVKQKAATKVNLPLWYQISQARYAYRIHEFDAWLTARGGTIETDNAMMQMVIAMHSVRSNRTPENVTALSDAIAEAEASFQITLSEGTYNKTWHGVVATLVWIDEANQLIAEN